MMKNYKIGFDFFGLLLFLILMLPNFIWFAIPAPNDVLRKASVTTTIDMIASVCQVLMIMILCFLKHKESGKLRLSPLIVIAIVSCTLYYLSWVAYYTGLVNPMIILGLTVFPCMSFLFFALDRKKISAIVPISMFTICHVIYGIINFIM